MNQIPMNQQNTNLQGNMAGQQNMQMTDEDIIGDVLLTEKTMIGYYAATACETSCPNLRQVLVDNLSKTVGDQYAVFDQMRQRNWYPLKNAPPQEVQDAKNKFTQMKNQICH